MIDPIIIYNSYLQVDKILADKLVDGVKQYKIHWAGYSSDHDSWEPDTSLIGCSSIIQDYNSTKVL